MNSPILWSGYAAATSVPEPIASQNAMPYITWLGCCQKWQTVQIVVGFQGWGPSVGGNRVDLEGLGAWKEDGWHRVGRRQEWVDSEAMPHARPYPLHFKPPCPFFCSPWTYTTKRGDVCLRIAIGSPRAYTDPCLPSCFPLGSSPLQWESTCLFGINSPKHTFLKVCSV